MMTIIFILLILLLIGAIPAWPHAANWGYGPGGAIALVLIILLILMVADVIPSRF